MALIEKEIKWYPNFGLSEIVRETAQFYVIKMYGHILQGRVYQDYSQPCKNMYSNKIFYIFDDNLYKLEFKVSKKNFNKYEYKTYFLKKGDIYVKDNDGITIKEKDDLFFSDITVRDVCMYAQQYCENIRNFKDDYDFELRQERLIKILRDFYKFCFYFKDKQKKYVKKWLKKNIRKYSYDHEMFLPDIDVIKTLYKQLKK